MQKKPLNCATCTNRQSCVLSGVCETLHKIQPNANEVILHTGDSLSRIGEPMSSVCFVKSGSLKSSVVSAGGYEQISGFYFRGAVLGLDELHLDKHQVELTALETCCVCKIPVNIFLERAVANPEAAQQYMQVMSRSLAAKNNTLLLLGQLTAEQRMSQFILNMSSSMYASGYSDTDFNLSMSRGDIANYLSLAVETVSRLLRRFQDRRLIHVDRRRIFVLDKVGLQAVLECESAEPKFRKSA